MTRHDGSELQEVSIEEQGQGLVEFAFVVTILVLFLMGVFDLGRAVYYYNTIAASAREGARRALTHTSDCSTADPAIKTAVVHTTAGVPISESNITIHNCPRAYGDTVTVTISVDFTPLTPIIAWSGGGAFTMRAQSKMIVE